MNTQVIESLITLAYMAAAVCFIFGLKMMSSPHTAVRGNRISAVGMLIAIVVTLLDKQITTFTWIAVGLIIGSVIGAVAAIRVPMTSMPGFVAFFNGTGGLASMLVGCIEYIREAGTYAQDYQEKFVPLLATYLAILIGAVTFTGSMIAYAKLEEKMNSRPILFRGQQTACC